MKLCFSARQRLDFPGDSATQYAVAITPLCIAGAPSRSHPPLLPSAIPIAAPTSSQPAPTPSLAHTHTHNQKCIRIRPRLRCTAPHDPPLSSGTPGDRTSQGFFGVYSGGCCAWSSLDHLGTGGSVGELAVQRRTLFNRTPQRHNANISTESSIQTSSV